MHRCFTLRESGIGFFLWYDYVVALSLQTVLLGWLSSDHPSGIVTWLGPLDIAIAEWYPGTMTMAIAIE